MKLQLIGVNHKTAPVEVRESLAIPEWRLEEATRRLLEHPGVEECFVLSTCNRVEFTASSEDGVDLRAFLGEYLAANGSAMEKHLYEYEDSHAVRHLFRVSASLDSMIVGEPQILGQVKQSYAIARAVGAVQSNLDTLLTRALSVGKRVRTETAIGSSAVSVASVAVELAKKIFGSLHGRNVYLVGAGKMSELAARHLRSHGAAAIFVANRTHERAVHMADKVGGSAIPFEQLYETADQADIVISSTGAPHAIFRREHGELFMQRRKNRPMFFIDIAVPRDVDQQIMQVDGIFVYDIDDLQQVVKSNASGREREAERAELLIEEEVIRYQRHLQSLDAVPTIIALQEHVESIRQAEVERLRHRMSGFTLEQQAAVEHLTRSLVKKILHPSITALKHTTGNDQRAAMSELLHKLFGLELFAVSNGQNGKGTPDLLSSTSEPDQSSDPDSCASELAQKTNAGR